MFNKGLLTYLLTYLCTKHDLENYREFAIFSAIQQLLT